MIRSKRVVLVRAVRALVVCLFLGTASQAALAQTTQPFSFQTEQDLNLWVEGRVTHVINEDWSVSGQFEIRLNDDIGRVDERIYKLYAHHVFTHWFGLSFGYKYIDRPGGGNETDPWQELVFPDQYAKFQVSHQVRFEQRLQQNIDGILPRIRYLFHWSRPLGDSSRYLTGFSAVRFNLTDKGAGPVGGFEQVRVYTALGFFVGGFTRAEFRARRSEHPDRFSIAP